MTSTGMTATAHVHTDRPGRYGKQLVSHMSRKVAGSWDEEQGRGTLTFNDPAKVATLAVDGDALQIHLSAPAEDLAGLEDVIGRHLVRFGARDELVCQWVREDGSLGTSQRHTG